MIATLLCTLCIAPPSALPKIVREGEKVVLVEGRDRLVLRGSQDLRAPLGGGAELQVSGIYSTQLWLLRGGRKVGQVNMKDLGFSWLQENSLWGSETEAGEAREAAFRRGGLRAEVREVLPLAKGALAIVTWRSLGSSDAPVWGQHLVRIDADRSLRITPLRYLRGGRGSYHMPITRRLFRHGENLLLWLPGRMARIRSDGTDIGDFAEVPVGLAPTGLVEKRWALLMGDPQSAGLVLGAIDLDKRKAFMIFREPPREGGLTTMLSDVPERGRHLLLTRAVDARGNVERLTLEMPDGQRVKILSGTRVPPTDTWKGYAYFDDGDSVALYDARTGRFLRHLPVPRRAKATKAPAQPIRRTLPKPKPKPRPRARG